MSLNSPVGVLTIHIQANGHLSLALEDRRSGYEGVWTWEPKDSIYDPRTIIDIRRELRYLENHAAAADPPLSGQCYETRQDAIGRRLGAVLFGSGANEFDQLMKAIYEFAGCASERYIRVLLNIEFSLLNDLPWEAAIWPRLDIHLGTDRNLAMSRTRTGYPRTRYPEVTRPVDVLMTTSRGYQEDELRSAHEHISGWLQRIKAHSMGSLEVITTHSHLLAAAEDVSPAQTTSHDVFYYLGHGSAEGLKWIEDESGTERILGSEKFLTMSFFRRQIPPLIALLTCESDYCESTNLLAGRRFADQLIEAQAGAVLTIFGPLYVRAAPAIALLVHMAMKDGMALDRVVQYVRWFLYEVERDLRAHPLVSEYGRYRCKNWYRPILSAGSQAALDLFVNRGYVYDNPEGSQEVESWSRALKVVLPGPNAESPPGEPKRRQLEKLRVDLEAIGVELQAPFLAGLSPQMDVAKAVELEDLDSRAVIDAYEDVKWHVVAEAAVRGIKPEPLPDE